MQDNEKVSEALAEILEFLKAGLESGAEFASEQAPFLLQEILSLGLINAIVSLLLWLCIPAVAMFVCWRGLVWLRHKCGCNSWDETDGEAQETAWVFSHWAIPIASAVWVVIALGIHLPVVLKILIAPRLYLIEQVQHLIR